ncbi:hypothetical protein, partial [Kaistella haifensis]|uniref:hypothetical protein n=1 Tax=Kaistella haifensis TaxID=421525 RepID=UPI0006898E9D
MKKIYFTALLTLTFLTASAQKNFEIGAHVGIPVGDTSDGLSFAAGLNLAYTATVANSFKLGIASGYSHYFKKDIGKDLSIVPIAAKAKYMFQNVPLFIDLDLGYGISVNESYKGGFYAYPKVGYKMAGGEIYLGYQNLSSKYNFDYFDLTTNTIRKNNASISIGSINLGYTYIFK